MSNRFFVLSGFNTTYFGLHSLKSFSLKIWNIIPDEVKNSLRLDDFKIRMQQWAPNNYHCKLCRSYTQHVGYVNITQIVITYRLDSVYEDPF